MNVQSILGVKGSDVAVIERGASLADAVAALRDRGIGALVVSADGRHIEGIVSERDIVRAFAAHGASALGRTVASVMSTDVATCRAADGVQHLMEQMTERRIRHLPVSDSDGRLAGVVHIGEVVESRLMELQSENQALVDYLHQGR